jgi:hypothetical protein
LERLKNYIPHDETLISLFDPWRITYPTVHNRGSSWKVKRHKRYAITDIEENESQLEERHDEQIEIPKGETTNQIF